MSFEYRIQVITRCIDCIHLYEPKKGFPECSFPPTKGMQIRDASKIAGFCEMPAVSKFSMVEEVNA